MLGESRICNQDHLIIPQSFYLEVKMTTTKSG